MHLGACGRPSRGTPTPTGTHQHRPAHTRACPSLTRTRGGCRIRSLLPGLALGSVVQRDMLFSLVYF